LVHKIRKRKPRCGGKKLFKELENKFTLYDLKLGRDAFFDILRANNLLIRKRKKRINTTMSFHWLRKYPNLIENWEAITPNQLWVSDITYVETALEVTYLSLITDAYSRKIVGWHLSSNLKAEGSIKALNMALTKEKPKGKLIHHSDRGIQYCSNAYVKILNKKNIKISMTQSGNPKENAIAERVNGILKEEWLNDLVLDDLHDARKKIKNIIKIYNTERLHTSIDYLTPEQAHKKNGKIKRQWKTYYKKRKVCSV